MGHHVPNLEFIRILFSDEEVLPPETRFYQRMLAMDLEEATDVAKEFLKSCKSLEQLFDRVIVPALTLAEKDRHQGTLDDVRQQFIFQNTRILVEDITERADEITDGKTHEKSTEANSRLQKEASSPALYASRRATRSTKSPLSCSRNCWAIKASRPKRFLRECWWRKLWPRSRGIVPKLFAWQRFPRLVSCMRVISAGGSAGSSSK
jgi:hypothetical protein